MNMMKEMRQVAVLALLFSICSSTQLVAQEYRDESKERGFRVLEPKLDLILKRLESIEARLERLESKSSSQLEPVRATEKTPTAVILSTSRQPSLSIPSSIENGMRLDALERTGKRKALDSADPFYWKRLPYGGLFIEAPPLRLERLPRR